MPWLKLTKVRNLDKIENTDMISNLTNHVRGFFFCFFCDVSRVPVMQNRVSGIGNVPCALKGFESEIDLQYYHDS